MGIRAWEIVWWPGLKKDIEDVHESCISCRINGPSQATIPPVYPESSEFPICRECARISGTTKGRVISLLWTDSLMGLVILS